MIPGTNESREFFCISFPVILNRQLFSFYFYFQQFSGQFGRVSNFMNALLLIQKNPSYSQQLYEILISNTALNVSKKQKNVKGEVEMKRVTKRLLALVIAMIMVLTSVQITVFADTASDTWELNGSDGENTLYKVRP